MRGLVSGSFDPITLGHIDIIDSASKLCDELIVCMFINEEKDYFFTKSERLEMLNKALSKLRHVTIDSYDGMVYDYCKNNKIDCIFRGFRNSKDYVYETLMSEYNYTNCGIITKLIPSKEKYINLSSTKIREMIDKQEDWEQLVPIDVIEIIKNILEEKR